MKKITICAALIAALLGTSACNDEWKDELYMHLVSLKAPVNDQGVADIYLRYETGGEVIYDLPVLISGSTLPENAIDVRIEADYDTLKTFNDERFHEREDLWYLPLEEKYYEFLSPVCHIPAGSNKELFQIKFKFSDLDLSRDYVLPLTVSEDPSYVTNKRKGWRKAFLHVLPFNDYSGNYSASALNIYFSDSSNDPLVVDTKRAYVVDENTIFFYAGSIQDNALHRERYKIKAKFEEPVSDDEGKQTGNLILTADDSGIGFKTTGQCTYEIREEEDATQPYLIHRYVTLYLKYEYTDVTSATTHMAYRAEGSMVMERKINSLIPDRDQAIQW